MLNKMKVFLIIAIILMITASGIYSIKKDCEIRSFDSICESARDILSSGSALRMETVTTTSEFQCFRLLQRIDSESSLQKTVPSAFLCLLTVLFALLQLNHCNSVQFNRNTHFSSKIRQRILLYIHQKDGKK